MVIIMQGVTKEVSSFVSLGFLVTVRGQFAATEKQNRSRTYYVTLRNVRATTGAVETQQVLRMESVFLP